MVTTTQSTSHPARARASALALRLARCWNSAGGRAGHGGVASVDFENELDVFAAFAQAALLEVCNT